MALAVVFNITHSRKTLLRSMTSQLKLLTSLVKGQHVLRQRIVETHCHNGIVTNLLRNRASVA